MTMDAGIGNDDNKNNKNNMVDNNTTKIKQLSTQQQTPSVLSTRNTNINPLLSSSSQQCFLQL